MINFSLNLQIWHFILQKWTVSLKVMDKVDTIKLSL